MASMLGMWTRERTTVLIGLYEKHELLYHSKLLGYRNKEKRKEALEAIANEIRVDLPGITAEDIKSKINGIRTQYVSELNRIALAQMKNEDYEPSLWFFDKLSFLREFTQPKMKQCTAQDWDTTQLKKDSPETPRLRRRFTEPVSIPSRMPTLSFPDPVNTDDMKQESHNEPDYKDKNAINTINNVQTIKNECFSDDEVYIVEDDPIADKNPRPEQNGGQNNYNSPTTSYEEPYRYKEPERETNDQDRIIKMIASSRNSEITITPKNKRRNEEEVTREEKIQKREESNNQNKSKEDERIELFGQFVASQVKTIKNKILRVKLEHAIQNSIIEAQLKQIEEDNKQSVD